MFRQDKFLREQKVLRLVTMSKKNIPHIVPVWYMYSAKKIFIGTNSKSQKAKNIMQNKDVAFCVDVGVMSPDIYGVMGQGKARLIRESSKVKRIGEKILLRYFKTIQNKSAQELLHDTDCIIQITPERYSLWHY